MGRFAEDMGGYLGAATPDGGVLLVGGTGTSDSAEYQLHVAKQNGLGGSLWNLAYGEMGLGYLSASAMVVMPDGGCAVAGRCYDGNRELPFLLRIDPQGTVIWERHMSREIGFLDVTRVVSVGESGYAVSGVGRLGEGRLLRLDADGNLLWSKQYDGNWNIVHGFSVDVAPDGGFVIAGAAHPAGGTSVPAVIRTDADGTVLWTVDDVVSTVNTFRLQTYYTAHDVLVDGEGRTVVVGEFVTCVVSIVGESVCTVKGYMMQFDSTGHLNWNRSLSTGSDGQTVNRVTLTPSGDYITVGETGSKIQVIRVRTDGTVM